MARERAIDTATLVAAAAETFRRKGYRNATIDDIAEAAGISRPTVYKYARNKQHLLDLMVDEVTGDFSNRITTALESGEPAPDRLRALIATHVEAANANRTFYAIVLSEEVELSEYARETYRSWARERTRDFRDLLDECLPAGSGIDATVAANLVLSMLTTLYRWYHPEGSVHPNELAHQIELILRVLFDS
jgi:TetR/AcrR family transcriptional regulator, cholesterol catabolism regulator